MGQPDRTLERWQRATRAQRSAPRAPLAISRDVYCDLDNDGEVHARFDAQALAGRMGLD